MNNSKPDETLLQQLAAEYNEQALTGLFLAGSGARSELSEFSDIDLVLVHKDEIPADVLDYRLLYRDNRLISLHRRHFKKLVEAFNAPWTAIRVVQGLRDARILQDHDGLLQKLQKQAVEFVWSDELKAQSLRLASNELVGNVEELHKLLKGLQNKDPYTLLNGVWGIGMAMPKTMALVHGVLSRGDNAFFKQVQETVGADSDWSSLHKNVMAASWDLSQNSNEMPLINQAKAAAKLFAETFKLCETILLPEDKLVIEKALKIAESSGVID